jgi:hypothetical protein
VLASDSGIGSIIPAFENGQRPDPSLEPVVFSSFRLAEVDSLDDSILNPDFTAVVDSIISSAPRSLAPSHGIGQLKSRAPKQEELQSELIQVDFGSSNNWKPTANRDSNNGSGIVSQETAGALANSVVPSFRFGGTNANQLAKQVSALDLELEFAAGSFCTLDGEVQIASLQPQSVVYAEGEGDDPGPLALILPSLRIGSFSGPLSSYSPTDASSYSTLAIGGSFTADSVANPDYDAPGTNWVHTVTNLWTSPTHWSYSENLIGVFNLSETESDNGEFDEEDGESSGDDEDTSVTGSWNSTTTLKRNGFVRFSITVSQGMTSVASAGVAWSINMSYLDRLSVELQGGGSSSFASEEPSSDTSQDSNNRSADGDEIPPDTTGIDELNNVSGEASWNVGFEIGVYASGSFSISNTPTHGTDGGVDRNISANVTAKIGGDARESFSWNATSQSGNLSLPDYPAGQGEHPLSRCPVDNMDDPFGQVEGNGTASRGSGSGLSEVDGSLEASINFNGEIRNGQFSSLSGSTSVQNLGTSNDQGEADQIYVAQYKSPAGSPSSVSVTYKTGWNGDGSGNGDSNTDGGNALTLDSAAQTEPSAVGSSEMDSDGVDNGEHFEIVVAEYHLNNPVVRNNVLRPDGSGIDVTLDSLRKVDTVVRYRSDTVGEGLGDVENIANGSQPDTTKINTSIDAKRDGKLTIESTTIMQDFWIVEFFSPWSVCQHDDDWTTTVNVVIDTVTEVVGGIEGELQADESVSWTIDATLTHSVTVDYESHEIRTTQIIITREPEPYGSEEHNALYRRDAELEGGRSTTTTITGGGNTGTATVEATGNISQSSSESQSGAHETAISELWWSDDETAVMFTPVELTFEPNQFELMLEGIIGGGSEASSQGDGEGNGNEGGGTTSSNGRFGDGLFGSWLGSEGPNKHRAGAMAREMGLLGTERHVEAAHAAVHMQSTFANLTPVLGTVVSLNDAASGVDTITGDELSTPERIIAGSGIVGVVLGGVFGSIRVLAKAGKGVDNVAETIGHATRRVQTVGDMDFKSQAAARREAMRRFNVQTSKPNNFQIEIDPNSYKNPNLRGPNGEPSELLLGIDLHGNNVKILHHKWGHQFKDNNTFELPHFQGPNGEHLSYPRLR